MIVFAVYRRTQIKTALATQPRYAIGIVTGKSYVVGPSSHDVTFFIYSVHDSTYSSSSSSAVQAGQSQFLVKFSGTDPAVCRFYNQVPIPKTIQEAPPGGWKEPPFPVPAEVLE